jgi:hypothetical protein
MLALAVTVVWNLQLTYCYIKSGLKKVSNFASPPQIINRRQMDLVISKFIKIKSEIQTKVLELFVPSGILSISTETRLKLLTYVKAILGMSVIKQHFPCIVHMGDQGRAHTFVQENVLLDIENCEIKMFSDHISEGAAEDKTEKKKKMINFSEMLIEDKEIVEDGVLA